MKRTLSRGWAMLAAMLAFALIPAAAQAPRPSDQHQRVEVKSQLIEAFDPREPERTQFGLLTFRGGMVLESSNRLFGGLSGLRVAPDGQQFLAVNDKGYWVRGRIAYRGVRPVSLADVEIAPILGPDGRPLNRRGWYDTEALTEDAGVVHVAIERVNEILRFDYAKDGLRARGQPIPVPPGIKTLPHNKSVECLAAVPRGLPLAGTLIAISEQGLDAQGNIRGFLLGRNAGAFSLKRTDEFDVSDCAVSPRGDLLVLERRFSWLRGLAVRIRSVPLTEIKPGALVEGPELIYGDMGQQIDNLEGLSVHRAADGNLVLTLVSDDNFSALQRTLLLQFTLAGE